MSTHLLSRTSRWVLSGESWTRAAILPQGQSRLPSWMGQASLNPTRYSGSASAVRTCLPPASTTSMWACRRVCISDIILCSS